MSSLVAMKCPSCDGALRVEDLDEANGRAKCSYCRALIKLPEPAHARVAFQSRGEVPMPSGLVVESLVDGVEIRRRWFTPMLFFLVIFCIFWNSILFFWYWFAWGANAPWLFKLFPIVHVAVGFGLTYFTIAGFVNTTTIRVANGRLSIAHHPLPWAGNREVDCREIEQLYCKECVTHGKSGAHVSYELWMKQKDKKAIELLAAGDDPDQALFLEQRLEREMKMVDRPVAGELPR